MSDFIYGISTFQRRRGDFPELPVKNMFAEDIPTEPGISLQSRPGLQECGITMGSGPVRELYQIDGVLNNGLFGVSGNDLYNGENRVGSINGTGNVSFAGYEDYVFVNAERDVWAYDGSTLSSIEFPDGAAVSKIVVGASRLIALRADTGQFYWSGPLNTTIDALSFATAENSPDFLVDMLYIGDRLILFGSETVEFWPATSDADLPFAPLPGSVYPVGIKGTGMAALFNRTFAWVTNYNEVCVGDPDNIVSDPELQIRISESDNVHLWVFYVDDNEYLAVTLDNETWVFGARTGVWSTLSSYGQPNWVCQCYENGCFGTSNGPTLVEWSKDSYVDLGGPLTREFSGWVSLTGEPLWLDNITLRTNPGTTPFLSGDYAEPVVELRTSKDGGRSFQPWKPRTTGRQGLARAKTVWGSMGQFGYPGVLVQIRNSDPVPFRVSGLTYNEPFGGI